MSPKPGPGLKQTVKRRVLRRYPLLACGTGCVVLFVVLTLARFGIGAHRRVEERREADLDRTVSRMTDSVLDYASAGGDPDDAAAFRAFGAASPMERAMMEKAMRGDADAAFSLYTRNKIGIGDMSDAQAFGRLEKAAELGHPEAALTLASEYNGGGIVPKDEAKAAEWTERAASAGDPGARYNMYVHLFDGRGVARDRDRAIGRLIKSAEGGQAQYHLALHLATGDGLPPRRGQGD